MYIIHCSQKNQNFDKKIRDFHNYLNKSNIPAPLIPEASSSSTLRMNWNSSLWRIYKKKWKQSFLFSCTVSKRYFVCFTRVLVSVILSWAGISIALSSNRRSQRSRGSSSVQNISSYVCRHVMLRLLRLGDKIGLPADRNPITVKIWFFYMVDKNV